MIKFLIVTIASLWLASCTQTMRKDVILVSGPSVTQISSPYDVAMSCIRKIPETKYISIGVLEIRDGTGKVNIAEGGTGSFVTQGATDQFYSSLAQIGVPRVESSDTFRKTTQFYGALGVKARIGQPKFVLTGSITGLDFLPGNALEGGAYGVGAGIRRYNAVGRMDVRLTTLAQKTAGIVIANSRVHKQFAAVEYKAGFGRFLGSDSVTTFASFSIGGGKREPLQLAIGYLADYAASDLVLQLLLKINKKRVIEVSHCRSLLDNPFSTETLVASAT